MFQQSAWIFFISHIVFSYFVIIGNYFWKNMFSIELFLFFKTLVSILTIFRKNVQGIQSNQFVENILFKIKAKLNFEHKSELLQKKIRKTWIKLFVPQGKKKLKKGCINFYSHHILLKIYSVFKMGGLVEIYYFNWYRDWIFKKILNSFVGPFILIYMRGVGEIYQRIIRKIYMVYKMTVEFFYNL